MPSYTPATDGSNRGKDGPIPLTWECRHWERARALDSASRHGRCRSAGVETLSPNCFRRLLLGFYSSRWSPQSPGTSRVVHHLGVLFHRPAWTASPHSTSGQSILKGALRGVPAPTVGYTLTSDTRWHRQSSRGNLAPRRGPGEARQQTPCGEGLLAALASPSTHGSDGRRYCNPTCLGSARANPDLRSV
jgi:hypothetical protein